VILTLHAAATCGLAGALWVVPARRAQNEGPARSRALAWGDGYYPVVSAVPASITG